MKRKIFCVIGIALTGILAAQNTLDIITLSGRNAFATGFDSVLPGKAKETGSFVAITVPVPLTKKTIIYNSLNYFYFHVDNIINSNNSDPLSLHGFILRTGIVQRLGNGQSIQMLVSPRLMTDMKGGGIKNMQFGGLAVYEKNFNEKLTMGFGSIVNNEFFGPYLVPVINLNWNITNRFSISGMLPVYAKIKYKFSEKFNAGISHFGLTTSFRLNDDNFSGDYIERQSIDLAVFANYQLAKNIYIEGRFGQSMNRCYKQYSSDDKVSFAMPLATFGDKRTVKNIQFKDGAFAELRFVYSIPLPKE
ncbi:MAG: hypothetical protein JXB34_03870 [Bacteroidales bacterium]|nr:hypothetical protein [Bacteroidales bacterium]